MVVLTMVVTTAAAVVVEVLMAVVVAVEEDVVEVDGEEAVTEVEIIGNKKDHKKTQMPISKCLLEDYTETLLQKNYRNILLNLDRLNIAR